MKKVKPEKAELPTTKSAPKKTAPSTPPPVAANEVKPQLPRNATVRLELFAPEAKAVFVAGSFNNWRPDATAMKLSKGGRWAQDLVLPPGKYEYLFHVDGQWTPDPQARGYTPNPFGGKNSLLEVP